jgi:lipid A 4'-phosphatase
MSKISLIIAIILTAILGVFLWHFSNLDLQIAQHYYLGNNKFYLLTLQWPQDLRQAQNKLLEMYGFMLLILFIMKIFTPDSKMVSAKFILYAFVVFMVVPGLVVNTGFKNHFHRPRPREVHQFGGQLNFKPAFVHSEECPTNCSFVCGDAAAMFTFWAFLPFFRRWWKYIYGTFVFAVGCLYGYIRIGQGGHFFSDVVFAALFTYIGVWLVYWFFYSYAPRGLSEPGLQARCQRINNWLYKRIRRRN